MKFGKLLLRRAVQVEPYKSAYVNYKLLKKIIKDILSQQNQHGGDPEDLTKVPGHAKFFFYVANEASKVDALYESELVILTEQLTPLMTTLNETFVHHREVSSQVLDEFTTLCKRLDQLRAFVIVNYLAFAKIMKKYDKKCKQNVKDAVSESIQVRPFYCSHALAELLTQTEIVMNTLSGKSSRDDYNCPVCLNILSNPVVLSCAHRFCWHCLAKASLFGQCCPVCRKQQTLDPRHYNIDSTLQNFVKEHFPIDTNLVNTTGAASASASALASATNSSSDAMVVDESTFSSSAAAAAASSASSSSSSSSVAAWAQADFYPQKPKGDSLEAVLQGLSVKEAQMDVDSIPRIPIQIDTFSRLLRHSEAGNIIILDLDETVVMTPTTSLLFSHEGIRVFENFIHRLPADTTTKSQHCQRLQAILDDKVPVEPVTTTVIKQLQEHGCWVMGCTARYASMAPRTQQTLTTIGVDLNVNAPFPSGRALQDPDTQAVYANGVIFTNAVDKGEVLNSFFENVIFRGIRRERVEDGSLRWSQPLPSEIVFVDDRLSNSESVLRGLHVVQKMQIPVTSYHFVGAAVRAARVDMAPNSRSMKLLQLQVAKFIESHGNLVLTDEAAAQHLEGQL